VDRQYALSVRQLTLKKKLYGIILSLVAEGHIFYPINVIGLWKDFTSIVLFSIRIHRVIYTVILSTMIGAIYLGRRYLIVLNLILIIYFIYSVYITQHIIIIERNHSAHVKSFFEKVNVRRDYKRTVHRCKKKLHQTLIIIISILHSRHKHTEMCVSNKRTFDIFIMAIS